MTSQASPPTFDWLPMLFSWEVALALLGLAGCVVAVRWYIKFSEELQQALRRARSLENEVQTKKVTIDALTKEKKFWELELERAKRGAPVAAAVPAVERIVERLPAGLARALQTLASSVDPRMHRSEQLRAQLRPHRSIIQHSRDATVLASKLDALPSRDAGQITDETRVQWVAVALQHEAILSETLGREILHALIRTQREATAFPVQGSIELLKGLAADNGFELIVPSVGERYERERHQPGGASRTSATGDLTVQRVLAVGLVESRSGLVESRAAVEVG
jgi:hypothetical protein